MGHCGIPYIRHNVQQRLVVPWRWNLNRLHVGISNCDSGGDTNLRTITQRVDGSEFLLYLEHGIFQRCNHDKIPGALAVKIKSVRYPCMQFLKITIKTVGGALGCTRKRTLDHALPWHPWCHWAILSLCTLRTFQWSWSKPGCRMLIVCTCVPSAKGNLLMGLDRWLDGYLSHSGLSHCHWSRTGYIKIQLISTLFPTVLEILDNVWRFKG